MKRAISVILLVAMFFCLVPIAQVMAADTGDPIFPLDVRDRARGGIVYENIDRGLDVTAGPEGIKSVKADTLYLRFNTDVGQMASLDFDIGAINPKNGDYNYYIGGGLRMLVLDYNPSRVSVFAQLHYAPIETETGGVKAKYDYLEAEGGVVFSLKMPIEDQVTLMPYAGPVLSIVRLDGDVHYGDSGVKSDFDAEEKNLIGIVAGLTLKMKEYHSIRAELRYFDNFNFSVGATIAF